MQVKLITLALVGTVAAIPQIVATTKCNADNCARALTGTPAARAATRIAECSTFQTTTVSVTVISGTPTLVTQSTTTVPASLSSCTNSRAYASACSCAGVTPATKVVPLSAPTTVPTEFRIFDKDNSSPAFSLFPAYLGGDQQDYGNVGSYVLTRQVPAPNYGQPVFSLTDKGQLATSEQTPKFSCAYPGAFSKFYFGPDYCPYTFEGLQYEKYLCTLGTFDGNVGGYPLSCRAETFQTGPDAFYQAGVNPNNQATGNIGFGVASQASGEAQPPAGGAPDVFNQQLYAVGV